MLQDISLKCGQPQVSILGAAAFLLFMILATGCAVGPDYQPPEPDIPDHWMASVDAELSSRQPGLGHWWTYLGDPHLDDLITRAAGANKDLKIAQARVREARYLRKSSRADYFPQVDGRGGYSRSKLSENGAASPEASQSANDLYSIGFDAAWELDVFGRVQRSVEAASAEEEATIEDYRDLMVILYAEVARNYVASRSFQSRILYANENIASQADSLELTRNRFDAGLTSALDVAQAESNLAGTRSRISDLETGLIASLNRLAVLLGEHPGTMAKDFTQAAGLPKVPEQLLIGVPTDILRRRPDIRRAERQLAAQTARIGVTTSELYPRFFLPGSVGLEALQAGELFNSSSLAWNLTPGFRWNIFSAGKIQKLVKAEKVRTEQLLLRYEQTVLLALEEVENGLVAFRNEQIKRDHLVKSVEASQRAVELVRTQYTSGLTGFQSFLDSQRTLFSRQDELVESQGRVIQNLIALNKALGGGWSQAPTEIEPAESVANEPSVEPGQEGEATSQ